LEECGPCPAFAGYTLAFALQLRKKHGKTSGRVAEESLNCPAINFSWPVNVFICRGSSGYEKSFYTFLHGMKGWETLVYSVATAKPDAAGSNAKI